MVALERGAIIGVFEEEYFFENPAFADNVLRDVAAHMGLNSEEYLRALDEEGAGILARLHG